MDYIIINASEQNSVDTIRDDIKAFITTCGFGELKYVLLEEADYISLNGQAVLRRMMEDYADSARFILTCNYEHKIMPAIRSRCQQFRFKAFDRNDIAERVVTILASEKVKFKSLTTVDKYIAVGYPDIRKIINLLQQNTFDGTLQEYSDSGETADYKFALLDLIAADDWVGARDLLCGSVATEEWEDLYTFLYNNLNKSNKFSTKDNWEAGIVVIADHLYKNAAIADPEVNAAAMLIRLSQIGE